MAVVSGGESDLALAESHLVLKNAAWICFGISSSLLGNNSSLQIRSFSEDEGQCNKTGGPSISDFSAIQVPTSHMLSLAASSYVPSDEAY
jgi:hypothetical protein